MTAPEESHQLARGVRVRVSGVGGRRRLRARLAFRGVELGRVRRSSHIPLRTVTTRGRRITPSGLLLLGIGGVALPAGVLLLTLLAGCAAPPPAPTPTARDARDRIAAITDASARLDDLMYELGERAAAGTLRDALRPLAERADASLAAMFADAGSPPSALGTATMDTVVDNPVTGHDFSGAYLGLLHTPWTVQEALVAAADAGRIGAGALDADLSFALGDSSLTGSFTGGALTASGSTRVNDAGGSLDLQSDIEVQACPDADGRLAGNVSLGAATAAPGFTGDYDQSVAFTARVNDDARISAFTVEVSGALSSRGDAGTGSYIEGAGSFESVGDVSAGDFEVEGEWEVVRRSQHVTSEQAADFEAAQRDSGNESAQLILELVEEFLRGGSCLTVAVTPGPDALTRPGQQLEQSITATSRVDSAEIEGMAAAALTEGGAKVEPESFPKPTPAVVTYTGPEDRDGTGTVLYTVTSNRGIGLLELDYAVAEGWVVDVEEDGVTYSGVKCDGMEGDWVIHREGVPAGNGGTLRGEIAFSLDPVGGIGFVTEKATLSFGGDTLFGTWEGDVSFERTEHGGAFLTIDYTSGTITYDGVTAAADDIQPVPELPLRRATPEECGAGA
ncbi:hypothetical protein CLV46_2548 [Diaminobutyricimonas aerilata]|uniref:Uncharacterized protein n=1 Tax=Diaminobutyricimonas aerilata TaxID=1162967 RepID=A0A2M9CM81_9MICO|nr:hypothetical protein [Diaminobutyricimonas aerilata]PJJ72968.1 hypothetical protein CLV46_2548 [Diaminobutyricimonas aerilata]